MASCTSYPRTAATTRSKIYRDSKSSEIYEDTNEIQRMVIAR